jgi:hypothetical protein
MGAYEFQAPSVPSSLAQYKTDGITSITSNTYTGETTVVLKFAMSSTNSSDSLTPQVEIQHQGTAFTNIPNYTGSAVSYSGTSVIGTVTIPNMGGGNYHWQARVVNSAGQSAWVAMGANPDFSIKFSPTSNNSSASTCGDSVTTGTPNLFEIHTAKNSATLYFAPPTMPYSNFYVAYSTKSDIWEYGTQYNQGYSPGVLRYTINSLKSNTKYYFLLRAGNGCATGNWGNTMIASTSNSQRTYYKNNITSFVQNKKTTMNDLVPVAGTPNPIPTSSPTITAAPEINTPVPAQMPAQTQPVSKSKFCILWWCF